MPSSATITVLVDNSASKAGLIAEHGLAVWLDLGERRVLFDTGQTEAILANAQQLGIDLVAADAVVLSHGHYDHCGGLVHVLGVMDDEVPIHIHPIAMEPKYRHAYAGGRYIGMSAPCLELLRRQAASLQTVTAPTEIAPGLFLTGEIPRAHPQERSEEGFCLDADGRRADPLRDDQALFFGTAAGTIVLLGCAHAGVINTLDYIRHLTGGQPIHAVLGGMHLRSASDERIAWTLDALRQFSVERLYPAHCTGAKAVAVMQAAFPGRCLPCGVGTTLNV
jgi:7,8-dihydropterin-6-yl-methyl-4-(beta-D-ribofuranosyl)aminobenzene 5'-phosphate synthase